MMVHVLHVRGGDRSHRWWVFDERGRRLLVTTARSAAVAVDRWEDEHLVTVNGWSRRPLMRATMAAQFLKQIRTDWENHSKETST